MRNPYPVTVTATITTDRYLTQRQQRLAPTLRAMTGAQTFLDMIATGTHRHGLRLDSARPAGHIPSKPGPSDWLLWLTLDATIAPPDPGIPPTDDALDRFVYDYLDGCDTFQIIEGHVHAPVHPATPIWKRTHGCDTFPAARTLR